MHTLAKKPTSPPAPASLVWRGFAVRRGDASTIAGLTIYGRNYVDKVLRGKRKCEAVTKAALKFYQLRKELQG